MSKDFISQISWSVGCWVIFLSIIVVLEFSLTNFEMLDQLPLRDFSSASFAFEVRTALVRI
jgi:hypothetical protein